MQQKISIVDLIPSHWFNDLSKSSIWMVGYRMMRTSQQAFSTISLIADLPDVRAIFIYGILNYFDNINMFDFGDNHVYKVDPSKLTKESNIGSWTLLITPYNSDGNEREEPDVRNSISVAEGLLAALNSPNIVYQKVFENILELSSLNVTAGSPVIVNPLTDPAPNIEAPALQLISQSTVNLQALPENTRNRVSLSLRWYSKSLTEAGHKAPVDEFLSIWIAIEVIGMPDTSNVKPAIESLAKIYQLDYQAAVNRFQLGRIHGVRNKIVHDGQMFPIHFLLTKYLEAVYIDLLLEALKLPHERRAEQVLKNPQFDLQNFIKALPK